jgi:predicted amidohydrolase YtcJ
LRGEIDAGYPAVHSILEVTQALAHRAATLPQGQWIVGSGWDDAKLAERRYITRQDLDTASRNHPVYLKHVSGHLGVANSAALKLANIIKETHDPQGGVIERDASGEREKFAVSENTSIHIAIPAQGIARYGRCGQQGWCTRSSKRRP